MYAKSGCVDNSIYAPKIGTSKVVLEVPRYLSADPVEPVIPCGPVGPTIVSTCSI